MIRQGLNRWGAVTGATDEQQARAAIEEVVSGYHLDCELDFTRTLPDFPREHGPEAMVRWMTGARTALAEATFTPGEIVETGDSVVVPVRVTARPRGAEGVVHMDFAYVFRFRGEKIAAATSYPTLQDALEATTAAQ